MNPVANAMILITIINQKTGWAGSDPMGQTVFGQPEGKNGRQNSQSGDNKWNNYIEAYVKP